MKYGELYGIISEIRNKLCDTICSFLVDCGDYKEFSFGEHAVWLYSQYGQYGEPERVRLVRITELWKGYLCFEIQTKENPISVENLVQPAGEKINCTPTEKDKLYYDTRNLNDFGIETLLQILGHLEYMVEYYPEENKKIERP